VKNSDMPAMPLNSDEHADGFMNRQSIAITTAGLTKREHFAAMAMMGVMSADMYCDVKAKECAKIAVANADALLAELEKEQAQ